MDYETVKSAVDGVPNMSATEGRSVYDHLRRTGARDILEIGTAHAVSASYMAAAVEENGGGKVTTVDHVVATADRDPAPADVLERTGLGRLVDRVLVEDSSYTWWLKQQVEEHSDEAGNVEPQYDFCYLDGAHNWTIDGFSVYLIEKLLRPDAWILLDDLRWSYDPRKSSFGREQGPDDMKLSDAERSEPHVMAVWNLIVRQHPNFTDFKVENEDWGWARKSVGDTSPRTLEVVYHDVPVGIRARQTARRLRATGGRVKRRVLNARD